MKQLVPATPEGAAAVALAEAAAGSPGRWFFWVLALGLLSLCAGYAALVLDTATWAEARALDTLFPYYDWHIRSFSPAEFHWAQLGLSGLALVLGAAGLGLGAGTQRGRQELHGTWAELRGVGRHWRAAWRAVPHAQRRVALVVLALLTAARLYLSPTTPWADDGVSFEYFVRQPLLAVSAYYPLPNNHILSNTISWLFYQVHPGFWWSMRLPVLLTSSLATVVLFFCLLRRAGFWRALLAAGAGSWLQLSLFHAAAGRGYWLVMLATGIVFSCMLALLDQEPATEPGGAPRWRVAWLGLVGASVLSCYAVPTAAYLVASAFSWLGGQALWRRDWPLLGQAVAAGGVVAAGIGLLYAPTLLVSGPAALLANPYVVTQAPAVFWRGLPANVWFTEGFLGGQRSVGGVLILVGLGLFGRQLYRAATGRLPAGQARQVWALGLPALWFMLFPYVLVMAQRVLPPERTMLYKAWFFYLLVGLALGDWHWHRPALRRAAGVGAGLFALSQLLFVLRTNYQSRQMTANRDGVYAWLARQAPVAPALIPNIYTWALTRYTSHIERPGQPWPMDHVRRPGVRYAYVVLSRGEAPPAGTGRQVYANSEYQIFTYAGVR